MATHSRVLAWRIPGTEEPGGLPSMGSHTVGHYRRDLAAAVAAAQHLRARDITMNIDETPIISIGSCETSQTLKASHFPVLWGHLSLI